MAIVFDCPHCKTNYRLKDEFAGKTATCKNPNCRKIIPIPKPTTATAGKSVDIDALAAAAFSDEPAVSTAVAEESLQVTCSGCDHVWSVEASKEGKNVLCPECRRPNRVPLRKKAEKADWRTGENRPTLAKVETGLDAQGAWGANQAVGIGQETAREIVKDRESQEEPEERRRRLIKRVVYGFLILGVFSAGVYYLAKQRKAVVNDEKMEDAVKEYTGKDGKERATGPMFALIHRASGEYRIKAAANKDDAAEAMKDLKLARNSFAKNMPGVKSTTSVEQNAALAEVAVTMVDLLGTAEQTESGVRLRKDEVAKEIRQTLSGITDPEIMADALRAVTRKLAEKEQVAAAGEIALQLGNEMRGQVGLELLRIDRENKYRPEVEKLLASVQVGSEGKSVSIQALRLIFAKPGKKDAEPSATSQVSYAEKAALTGDLAGVKSSTAAARNSAERVQALIAAAHVLSESNAAESANLAEQAATTYAGEPSMPVSPWVGVRICRLLGKGGRFDAAEVLAGKIPSNQAQAQSWARLEILRGRLAQSKDKAEISLCTSIGEPEAVAAAAKAYEEVARHNAFLGQDYKAIVKSWKAGTVRPFGTAGLVLGGQERSQK
jgi:hypothetical protein